MHLWGAIEDFKWYANCLNTMQQPSELSDMITECSATAYSKTQAHNHAFIWTHLKMTKEEKSTKMSVTFRGCFIVEVYTQTFSISLTVNTVTMTPDCTAHMANRKG